MPLRSSIALLAAAAGGLGRRPLFREGAADALPMAIGIAAWGVVAGVAMVKSGMGVLLAILMSLLVYAGSAQIAVLPLISAGAPIWVVWAATLCVSLRFLAFSFHYRPYFVHLPRRRRLALSFLMSDSMFALFSSRFPTPIEGERHEDYFLGCAVVNVGLWQISITIGILMGHSVPAAWNLGFAGTMALLALTCTQLRSRATWMASVVAGSAAVATYALPLRLNIIVAIAAAVSVGILASRWPASRAGAGQ